MKQRKGLTNAEAFDLVWTFTNALGLTFAFWTHDWFPVGLLAIAWTIILLIDVIFKVFSR